MSRAWRLCADAAVRLRYWDDECVLYHGASGNTYRLPEAVGQLLEALTRQAADLETLAAAINLHSEDVEAALQRLAHLGIVETAPDAS